jgi:hypothetical protein
VTELTDVQKVRLLIADLDSANYTLTDDQVTGYLTIEGGSVKLAASTALEAIATSEALISKVIKTNDLSTDGAALAKELRAHAKILREQGEAEEGFFDIINTPTEYPTSPELAP